MTSSMVSTGQHDLMLSILSVSILSVYIEHVSKCGISFLTVDCVRTALQRPRWQVTHRLGPPTSRLRSMQSKSLCESAANARTPSLVGSCLRMHDLVVHDSVV